jgi:hypothetical protein
MKEGTSRVLGIALFVVMGASALVLGVMNTEQGISGPLKLDLSPGVSPSADPQLAELKNKDTDGDGISDYDELYVYRSSPYIKDSDSDGTDDGVEVKDGTDPICPKGQDCGTPAPVYADIPTDLLNISPDDLLEADGNGDAVLTPLSGTNGNILEATPDNVGQIRQMLKNQGLTDEILSVISDADLIEMYNDSIASAQAEENAYQSP